MIATNYLQSSRFVFNYYKTLGEKTFNQIKDEDINWRTDEDSNSIALIVKHLTGNMLSRWTDFRTTDGEKEWRNRDGEFEGEILSKEDLLKEWERGWTCFFAAFDSIQEEELSATVYIRGEAHTILDAINRQMAHYPYHVGQLVYIAKVRSNGHFDSLTIPKKK